MKVKTELEKNVADLRIELAQVKERLAQEEANNNQLKENICAFNSSLEDHIARRTRALTVVYKIMLAANHAESLEMLLDESLEYVMKVLECHHGLVMIFDGEVDLTHSREARLIVEHNDYDPPLVSEKGTWLAKSALLTELIDHSEPLLIPNIRLDDRIPEVMQSLAVQLLLLPIRLSGRVQGVVGLLRSPGPDPSEGDIALLTMITNQMGIAIQQLEQRLQNQVSKLIAERERLSRDLHDTITQSLYGLTALSEAGISQLEMNDLEVATHILKRIGQMSRQTLREMRLFIHELRPNILEQNGLVAALRLRLDAVEGRADIQTRLVADVSMQLPTNVETAFYRVAQEALNNSMRHSGASNVIINIQTARNEVTLEIIDDGCGFDIESTTPGGMGLENMRQYAHEIGAQLQINSIVNQGTTIKLVLPGKELK